MPPCASAILQHLFITGCIVIDSNLLLSALSKSTSSFKSLDTSLTIQFIEFTYTNDRFPEEKINAKINKYQPLLYNIKTLGWKVSPLIVISAGVRGITHIPSIKQLKTKYKFSETLIKSTLTNINTIATHHLTSIILHKKSIENNQPLPDPN